MVNVVISSTDNLTGQPQDDDVVAFFRDSTTTLSQSWADLKTALSGNDGVAGADGATGATGPMGATGAMGAAGNDGADGTDGVDGSTSGTAGQSVYSELLTAEIIITTANEFGIAEVGTVVPDDFLFLHFNGGSDTNTPAGEDYYPGEWHRMSKAQWDAIVVATAGDTPASTTSVGYRDFIPNAAVTSTARDFKIGKNTAGEMLVSLSVISRQLRQLVVIVEVAGSASSTSGNGNDGADGVDGTDGATGPTGPTGAAGTDGADGAAGAAGADGTDGATGATSAGATGPVWTYGCDGQ